MHPAANHKHSPGDSILSDAAPVVEGADTVIEEAQLEVAEDGERAMAEAVVDAPVASVDPVDGATAATAGECSRRCCYQ